MKASFQLAASSCLGLMAVLATLARAHSTSKSSSTPDCQVTLTPDGVSPQFVAAAIKWTATASAECGSQPVFKFSVSNRNRHHVSKMLRDFSRRNWFVWNPLEPSEHYRIRVEVKSGFDVGLPTSSETSRSYSIISPWNGGPDPVIADTTHPLIGLYSTPPCNRLLDDSAGRIRFIAVAYTSPERVTARTAWFRCNGSDVNDILVSGMRASTTYALQTLLMDEDGRVITLPDEHSYTTGPLPGDLTIPDGRIIRPLDSNTNTDYPIFWVSALGLPSPNSTTGLALDLTGRPLWYWNVPIYAPELTSPFAVRFTSGTMFIIGRDDYSPPASDNAAWSVFREVNLTGHPRFETNIDAVAAQTASGTDGFNVLGFHHDAVRLDDGYTVLIGYTTKAIEVCDKDCRTQTYLSDVLIALDDDGQVRWKWNAFDHFDPLRPAPVDYPLCINRNLGDICPPEETCLDVGPQCTQRGAKEFTHSNSVNPFPGARTDLLLSSRYQDWVSKIRFEDATADGAIQWKFGRDGSFELSSGTWQSHQHFPFITDDGLLGLLDNGNRRCIGYTELTCPFPTRGRAWSLDQDALIATPVLDIPLGPEGTAPTIYGMAMGSAEELPNGNWIFDVSNFPFAVEDPNCPASNHHCSQIQEWANPSGKWVQTYTYQFSNPIYRGFRLKDLYTGFTPLGSH